MTIDLQYLELLNHVKENGKYREDRTGTGTHSIFSASIEHDLSQGLPLLTTKKIALNAVIGELLWFLSGKTNLKRLRWFTFGDHNPTNKTIWDDNINTFSGNGFGGALYGMQWRDYRGAEWTTCDQIKNLVEGINKNPESRRLMVNAWNSAEIGADLMALPPCHFAFQCYVEDGKLSLKWNQRSTDLLLGCPFNLASYAILTHILCKWTGLEPGILVGDLTNVHVYTNHFDAVEEQLGRDLSYASCKPTIIIPEGFTLDTILDYTASDFVVKDYRSHGPIKAPMAV